MTMLHITLVYPLNIDGQTTTTTATALRDCHCSGNDNNKEYDSSYLLYVHQSRVLWTTLIPCIYESKKYISRTVLKYLFHMKSSVTQQPLCHRIINQSTKITSTSTTTITSPPDQCQKNDNNNVLKSSSSSTVVVRKLFRKRRFRIPNTEYIDTKDSLCVSSTIVLYIQPPYMYPLEYTWQGLLIKWEHTLIQAQSMTGYLATLGGGFFLCHHFQTALVLAQHQQRLAYLLSDEKMYYSCILNQIYNFIYAGKFQIANLMLKQVTKQIMKLRHDDHVLNKMCSSAKLFCKRMQNNNNNASKTRTTTSSTSTHRTITSKTFDDYQRIRVVPLDQSKREDLIIPFQRLT